MLSKKIINICHTYSRSCHSNVRNNLIDLFFKIFICIELNFYLILVFIYRLNGRREYFLVFSQLDLCIWVIILVLYPNGFNYKMKAKRLYSVLLIYIRLPCHMLVNIFNLL